MSVTYTKESIWKGINRPNTAIVIPVNTVGVMGAGLAKQAKDTFSDIFTQYQQALRSGELTINKVVVVTCGTQPLVLFPTKIDWKNPSELIWVTNGLKYLKDNYTTLGLSGMQIWMPKLGCGWGGLKWDSVRPVIQNYFQNHPLEIVVSI